MKKMHKKQQHTAANVVLGMVAGGAVSAASLYYATQNRREVKRAAKKISNVTEHAVSNAVSGLDKAMTNITRNF